MEINEEFDEIAEIAQALNNEEDRASLNTALNRLALLAKSDGTALQLLLSTIVDKRLAEVSIRKIFFDEDAIDDCVQETVLAVIAGINSFRGEAMFLTWLDRVALNVARQLRRKGNRLSEPTSNEVPDRQSWARRISSIVATEIMVAEAFAQLTTEHREIIELREMQDLSYEQIASLIDLPVGTVRSRLSRARRELAQLLAATQRSRYDA